MKGTAPMIGLYRYCGNNTVNLTDPEGKNPLITAGIGAVIGGIGGYYGGGNSWQGGVAGFIGGGVGGFIGFESPTLGGAVGSSLSSLIYSGLTERSLSQTIWSAGTAFVGGGIMGFFGDFFFGDITDPVGSLIMNAGVTGASTGLGVLIDHLGDMAGMGRGISVGGSGRGGGLTGGAYDFHRRNNSPYPPPIYHNGRHYGTDGNLLCSHHDDDPMDPDFMYHAGTGQNRFN